MKKVGIIGAGISGLTTAIQLKNAGCEVVVFEKGNQPGGSMKTLRKDGWLAEEGPGTLLEVSGHVTELIENAGLTSEVIVSKPEAKKRYIVKDGKMMAMPDSLLGFVRTPLLSFKSKAGLLAEPFKKSGTKQESLADFVRRRLGDEILQRFVNPFVGGIYAGNPENLSVEYAFPRLYNLEQEFGSLIKGTFKGGPTKDPARKEIPRNKARMLSFTNGLQELPIRLTEKLGTVQLNTEVKEIRKNGSGFGVITSSGSFECEVLIYAGTAHGISKIKWPQELSELKKLQEITHPPVRVVSLGFKKNQLKKQPDGFGVLIPECENFRILGTQFNSVVFDGRVPDEEHCLLTTFVGGMRQPDEAHNEHAADVVLQELDKLMGISGEPVFKNERLWQKAIPQYEMNYATFKKVMDKAEQSVPGFFITGNFRNGISLGDSITGAVMLSKRIVSTV